MQIVKQIRRAIREAVNRPSRKPFVWGGLVGYHQLLSIQQGLHPLPPCGGLSAYLQQVSAQVEQVLAKNRSLATQVEEAHAWLERIAGCLHYPPPKAAHGGTADQVGIHREQVTRDMEVLLGEIHPDPKYQRVQAKLWGALRKRWKLYGAELLYCYEIPGLPPDTLQLESLFGRLRRHQRRISGRKSTRELHDFGQVQVLFAAETEAALLHQIRGVSRTDYQTQRAKLAQAEENHQFFRRLHHNPLETIQSLVQRLVALDREDTQPKAFPGVDDPIVHTP